MQKWSKEKLTTEDFMLECRGDFIFNVDTKNKK